MAIAVVILARRACKLEDSKIEHMLGLSCSDSSVQKCVSILDKIENSAGSVDSQRVRPGSTRIIPEYQSKVSNLNPKSMAQIKELTQ